MDKQTLDDTPKRSSASRWRFSIFWGAVTISNLGDGVRLATLPLLITILTSEPLWLSAVNVAIWLPWLLFGAIGGVIVDRSDKKRLIRNFQILRAGATLVLAASILLAQPPLWLILLVALVIGTGEVFVDSALQALIPLIVDESKLDEANGRVGTSELVANELAGPPVGAALFSVLPGLPFLLDSLSFLMSAGMIQSLSIPVPAASAEQPAGLRAYRAELKEGVQTLWNHSFLRMLAFASAISNVALAGILTILVLYVLDVLQGNEALYGLMLSLLAGGGVVGALLTSRVSAAIGRQRAFVVSIATSGLMVMLLGFLQQPILALGCVLILGISSGITNITLRTLRHQLVAPELLGRIISIFRVIGYGTIPFGAIAAGIIAEVSGIRTVFYIGGTIIVSTALLMALVLLYQSTRSSQKQDNSG